MTLFSSTAILCGEPPEIENGEVYLSSNQTVVGTLADYSCMSRKFRLVGAKQLVCLPTGQYDKPAPQCKGKILKYHQLVYTQNIQNTNTQLLYTFCHEMIIISVVFQWISILLK